MKKLNIQRPLRPSTSRVLVRRHVATPTSGQVPANNSAPKPSTTEEQSEPKPTSLATLRLELERLRRENLALRSRLGITSEVEAAAVVEAVVVDKAPALPAKPAEPAEKDVWSLPKAEFLAEMESRIQWPAPNGKFWEVKPDKPVTLPESALNQGPTTIVPRDPRPLHVVHMTAELAPYAKVGGLGDVVQGLARACLARGHKVEVMLPYYECLKDEVIEGLAPEAYMEVPKGKVFDGVMSVSKLKTTVFRGTITGIPVLLVRPDWAQCNLFKGQKIYGGSYNEVEAYLFFCRACLEFLKGTNRNCDVIHLHEWQTAAAALLYWDYFNKWGLDRPRLMLTIHNMDNSGEVRQDEFSVTGVPGEVFATVDKALDERTIGHNPERLNLLKGGIIYANTVTTVSPTYAEETLTGGAAGWLRSTLAKPDIRDKYKGILNGIDTEDWDPARDPHLPIRYNPALPYGKAICKRFLQEGLGMNVDPNKPLVACITRLVPQKGIHLIKRSVYAAAQQGGQFVLLGTGHADGPFKQMGSGDFRDSKDVKLLLFYSEPLAHLIYAAADIVVVPSMFEPCGLTQMIAARYGAIPLVRKTGGLADTVKDVDEDPRNGNGYTFAGVDEKSVDATLERAFRRFRERPQDWEGLSKKNMETDFSWAKSAGAYAQIYQTMRGQF